MQGASELVVTIREKFRELGAFLDERARRRWAATESRALGRGGDTAVSEATGIARATIRKGRAEIEAGDEPGEHLREPGAGRPSLEEEQPGIHAALEALVDPVTRGDPESPLRWTSKGKTRLAAELQAQGWKVSATSVGRMLHALGFSLQAPRKTLEGKKHPDRNAQFEHINATADDFLLRGQPVISVDTKKKELVGEFKNGGQEWQPEGTPEKVQTHDFPTDAVGKAIPYGVYDIARNEGFVGVGCDLRQWWATMGSQAYPDAKELFITADAGGSNSCRTRAWKAELQKLADGLGLKIRVSHFPPGTSKWNKIEHRLFCHITQNWRGRPLRTFEMVVQLIGNTRTAEGLRVRAKLDKRKYPTGVTVSKAEMQGTFPGDLPEGREGTFRRGPSRRSRRRPSPQAHGRAVILSRDDANRSAPGEECR